MILPAEIELKILESMDLTGLTWRSARLYNKKIRRIRKQMYELARDFAQIKPSADKFSAAYFAYNFPANIIKTRIIIDQLKNSHPEVLADQNGLHVCDIGCGEGAAMIGAYYSLRHSGKIRFAGFDTSDIMLRKCGTMMQFLKTKDPRVHFRLQRRDLSNGLLKKKKDKYDLIILANSLAEMFKEPVLPVFFIERLLKSCKDTGMILIIEPATKQLARRLMALRNDLIVQQKAAVLSPCLHARSCPLMDIRGQKEWCHQTVAWHAPDYIKILNQGLNREIDQLKFSYLVIGQKAILKRKPNAFFVISTLIREKGKERCYLCTPAGRVELVRLTRHKSQTNKMFRTIKKGDTIVLDNITDKQKYCWHIDRNTRVDIINRMTAK
jgi:ribosomal protein RSM22 (predicted rRNA methylase)